MLEYLIYAILIFLPLGFLMARFLLKQGFAKKQITGFTITALAAVILFPISAARMGTTSTGIIFIFVLALFSWQIVKTEQLSTNEELNENSQFDSVALVRREESNKPVKAATEETTARSRQEPVNIAEETVVAISEPEMDVPEAVAVDLAGQETADVAEEEAIDIISEPDMDVSEAVAADLAEQEAADVPKEAVIGIAGPDADAPDEETIDLAEQETADLSEKETERSEIQITGPGTIDADEDRSQISLTHDAPAKMADTENSSDPTSIEPGLSDQMVNFDAESIEPNETTDDSSEREETVPAEAVDINDFEPEEKSSDTDKLTEFPYERDDMDDTPAVNSMIDAGFENKINGNVQEAVRCFKAALQLTDSADLKYLLSQELILQYEILGQYTNAINVLHNIMGSGLVSTAGLDQAQQKLEYFNRMIEELERLGIGEVPVSEVPRLVKIKVGQNT